MAETKRIAISNGDDAVPMLASVVPTSIDPTINWIVITNPDGSSIWNEWTWIQQIVETVWNITYIGTSAGGETKSDTSWSIKRVNESGGTTEIMYPQGWGWAPSTSHTFIRDNRATYTYTIS